MISIGRKLFEELYPDLCYDKYALPVRAGIGRKEFEKEYLSSKLWRMNNIYTFIPKKGLARIFVMNESQHIVYAASRKHPRIAILKSRQQGISTLWLISFNDDALFCSNMHIGLMAQGNKEAATLLERVKFLWDKLDVGVKRFAGVRLVKDNAGEISYSNKSKIYIQVSFRSATLQRLHISELGKIANANPKRAKETMTGTMQALARGNTGVIESTAEGDNKFKEIWDKGVIAKISGTMSELDFYPVFLSWLNDPDCVESVDQADTPESIDYFKKLDCRVSQEQKNFWIAKYRELGDDVTQEYPATPEEAFAASRKGTYYAHLYNEYVVKGSRIVKGLYDPNIPCDVYWDLGVDDYTVLGFVQWYRGEYRLVKDYFCQGMNLDYYLGWIRDSGIEVRELRFPHDIAVRELGSGGGGGVARSRLDIVKEIIKKMGVSWSAIQLKKIGFDTGVDNTKRMIKSLWIDASCEYSLKCLENYSKKYSEATQQFLSMDEDNQYTHGADMLRQVATGVYESVGSNDSRLAPRRREKVVSGYSL